MPEISAPTLVTRSIGRFTFEDGRVVDDATFAYAVDTPSATSDGLVIVCPSLTATPDTLRQWWSDVGASDAHARYTTLYPHAFSSSTIDALTPQQAPTIRDLARGIVALAQSLELPRAIFVTGGSMGGMLALEVALESGAPTHGLVLAAPAVQSAWGAGWNQVQLQALELGGPERGLELARAVGMLTYRTEREFEERFGVDADSLNGRTMAGYLRHHGQKLVQRFDSAEYERRVRAMDTHDVGRGRGGWREAITAHADRITGVGIIGDALYSADLVAGWTSAVGANFHAVNSVHGHDAFLLERVQIRDIIATAFARAVQASQVPNAAQR
jgi:homoserine O-acetyltransferase/O-succinyltransferase